MVESVVTKVNVIVTCTALVLVTFTGITWVILRTSVCNSHYHTSTVTSAVATSVVLAFDLKALAAHGGWAGWTAALAEILIPAVKAITFGTFGITATAAAGATLPKLCAITRSTTVPTLVATDRSSALCRCIVSSSSLINSRCSSTK